MYTSDGDAAWMFPAYSKFSRTSRLDGREECQRRSELSESSIDTYRMGTVVLFYLLIMQQACSFDEGVDGSARGIISGLIPRMCEGR